MKTFLPYNGHYGMEGFFLEIKEHYISTTVSRRVKAVDLHSRSTKEGCIQEVEVFALHRICWFILF